MSNEVEYKGIKVKGGKLLLIFPLLGTIGGAIWAGFEGYARWVAMEDQISSYTAPDLSGFTKQLSEFDTVVNVTNEKIQNLETKLENEITNMSTILQSEISTALELVQSAQGDARDIRNELRKDINEVMDSIAGVDKRTRTTEQEIRTSQRNAENDVRTLIQHAVRS